jgi:simple sugar transport system ATP-binding protein
LTEGLFLGLSVGTNLSAGVLSDLTNGWGLLDDRKMAGYEAGWISRLSIKTAGAHAPVSSLSGGNQQRVVLAKALARNPRVVVLNGPTVGVDVGSKDEIHQVIEKLSADGLGVILVSDDADELLRLCNRVLVMARGEIAHEVAGADLTRKRLEDISVEI